MTSVWLDDLESEAYDDSESDYDSESEYDSEDSRTKAARRARARRVELARRRMAQARAPRPMMPTRTAGPRQAAAAIRNLDLETKVGEDSLRRALEQANRRAARATFATAASVAVDQFLDSFESDLDEHEFIRAGLRVAPLLALSPQRKRAGLEGYFLDPRVIGGAAVVGVVAAGHFRNRGTGVDRIEIELPVLDTIGQQGQLHGFAVDRQGRDVDVAIRWKSSSPDVVTVSEQGAFEVKNAGTTRITADAGGHRESTFLTVRLTQAGGK